MGEQKVTLGVCLTFLTTFCLVTGELCTYDADQPCVCKTSLFQLNLQSVMDAQGGADFSIMSTTEGYTYYIQPCNKKLVTSLPLCESKTGGPLVSCQVGSGQYVYGLGVLGKYDATGSQQQESYTLTNSYRDNDSIERKMRLTIQCSDTTSQFSYDGNDGPSSPITYRFTLKTTLSCKGSAPSPGGSTGSVSVGTVMVIVFFVLLIVYFVGGILFLKFVKHAEGTALVPNLQFWKEIPLLIKVNVEEEEEVEEEEKMAFYSYFTPAKDHHPTRRFDVQRICY